MFRWWWCWWWCEFNGFDGLRLWDLWVWWVLLWFFVVGIMVDGGCFWFVADFLLWDVWVWWWIRWWWWGWARCGFIVGWVHYGGGGYGLGRIWGLWAFGLDLGGLDQIWWHFGWLSFGGRLCGFTRERDRKIERKGRWKSRDWNWIFYIICWYNLYILRRFRKLVIAFFLVKNTPKLINKQLTNWAKIVNWKKKVSYCFFVVKNTLT